MGKSTAEMLAEKATKLQKRRAVKGTSLSAEKSRELRKLIKRSSQ